MLFTTWQHNFNALNIIVNREKKIEAFQQEFHQAFPFLKIEFELVALDRAFADSVSRSVQFTVSPSMKLGDLESRLQKSFGVSPHVLRRAGNNWVPTNLADWSLQKLNRLGEALTGF